MKSQPAPRFIQSNIKKEERSLHNFVTRSRQTTNYLPFIRFKISTGCSLLNQAINLMIENQGRWRINQLSDHLKCSRRLLEKRFMEQFCISPKNLSRYIQFNYMLSILKYSPGLNWAELACKAGYYDQAHLIKTFIEFTGASPTQYEARETDEISFFY